MIDNVPVWLQSSAAFVLILYVLALIGLATVFFTDVRTQERMEADRDDSTWLDDQPAEIRAALAAEDFRLWTEELTP